MKISGEKAISVSLEMSSLYERIPILIQQGEE